jgi:hypothetical protein
VRPRNQGHDRDESCSVPYFSRLTVLTESRRDALTVKSRRPFTVRDVRHKPMGASSDPPKREAG